MTRQDLLEEILRLPVRERIELIGDVWDTIAASPKDLPTPGWHLDEVEKRLAEPDPQHESWTEVRERLRKAE